MTFMSEREIEQQMAKRNEFLAFFENSARGTVANDFLFVIRDDGITEPRLICREVYRLLLSKVARYTGESAAKKQYVLGVMRENQQAAMRFAEWAVWHETLDDKTKKRLKNRGEGSEHYQKEWMATQQPTARQLALLDSFGYQGTVDNRLHASQLIDEYITLRQDYRGRK